MSLYNTSNSKIWFLFVFEDRLSCTPGWSWTPYVEGGSHWAQFSCHKPYLSSTGLGCAPECSVQNSDLLWRKEKKIYLFCFHHTSRQKTLLHSLSKICLKFSESDVLGTKITNSYMESSAGALQGIYKWCSPDTMAVVTGNPGVNKWTNGKTKAHAACSLQKWRNNTE